MKIYTIIGGVNGTGKSSLTGVLKTKTNDLGKIIDVDKINALYGDKISGGKAAVKQISDCISKGISFTQETTLSGHKTASTVKTAVEHGYYIRLYYVGLNSCEESLKRIENRVLKGGHNIPPEDVTRRFATRFEDVAKVLPYCNEAVFFDNENGFFQVGEYRNGDFFMVTESVPEWFLQLRNYIVEDEAEE